MAKFDVYRPAQGTGYLLDCQADILGDLNTRFVVPLLAMDHAPKPAARLNPVYTIADQQCVMVTQFAASIPVRELGTWITSLIDEQDSINNALDMLTCGF